MVTKLLEGPDEVIEYLQSLGSKFVIRVLSSFSGWTEDSEGNVSIRSVLSIDEVKNYITSRTSGGKIVKTTKVETSPRGVHYKRKRRTEDDRDFSSYTAYINIVVKE